MNHRKKVNDVYKDKSEKGKWQQHNALVHARTIVHIHACTELSVHMHVSAIHNADLH